MTKEIRTAQVLGEVRETADGHEADLRILTYGVVDSYKTSWKPGVFSRSIESNKMPAVWSHDPTRPIGVVTDFRDDGQSLYGTLHYLPFEDVPDARMAWAAMKAGAMPGVSFAFERNTDEPDDENPGATRITDAEMIEVSSVLRAAVPGSQPLAVRHDDAGDKEDENWNNKIPQRIVDPENLPEKNTVNAETQTDNKESDDSRSAGTESRDPSAGGESQEFETAEVTTPEPQAETTADAEAESEALILSKDDIELLENLLGKLKTGARSEQRDMVTEADIPSTAAGLMTATKRIMKRTPHTPTMVGDTCSTCGSGEDAKVHTRQVDTKEIRDISIQIAADPVDDPGDDPNALIGAADAALDAAIQLCSFHDMTYCPWWVAQVMAFVLAADAVLDNVMDMLNIDDPDEAATGIMARALTDEPEVREDIESEPVVDTSEVDALLTRLSSRSRRPFDSRVDKEPYGAVSYADPGYQKDKVKRYPLSSKEKVKAAWSYINVSKNASEYSSEQLKLIKGRIKAAAKKFGINISGG